MSIFILRDGRGELVNKNHGKLLLTLFLVEQCLQKSLVLGNYSLLQLASGDLYYSAVGSGLC